MRASRLPHPRTLAPLAPLAALLLAVGVSIAQQRQPTGGEPPDEKAPMKAYRTRYYTLYTDLDDDWVREARLRITLMAAEYYDRTRGFAGEINSILPFYLFKDPADYQAAGGLPGSAGVFSGDKLMALAFSDPETTWHVVQHEGFHQFVHYAIGGDIPVWANEGLAEYFGQGIFTGDHFYTGLIPPGRLKRIQAAIKSHSFGTLHEMMNITGDIWNNKLKGSNYDQAWSMVHFLAHGDNGRYQSAFARYLSEVSRGTASERAWEAEFGKDWRAFEERWSEYWEGLPENPTRTLYAQAVVSTLTGRLARAAAQQQHFDDVDEFFAAAKAGTLKCNKEDWLPPRLLEAALERAPSCGTWSLVRKSGRRLVLEMDDGMKIEGSFTTRAGRVDRVTVAARPPKKPRK